MIIHFIMLTPLNLMYIILINVKLYIIWGPSYTSHGL